MEIRQIAINNVNRYARHLLHCALGKRSERVVYELITVYKGLWR